MSERYVTLTLGGFEDMITEAFEDGVMAGLEVEGGTDTQKARMRHRLLMETLKRHFERARGLEYDYMSS